MATGKISRLPREIREQVNQRLDAGEPGNRLVSWLNRLPAVRGLLAAEFGGAAINEQNLTNWKQGGFREWRMQQEVAALGVINAERRRPQSNAGGEETFNAQHSTLNGQEDGKPVEQQKEAEEQIRPAEGQLAVTAEQLVTVVAVRYLAAVREWQQSPVPAERRWRQMRVILQDVMKLQRGEHREQRLELDRERLEFVVERFEEGKQTDVRRVMVGFLAAAKQWPEVQEALAVAFRLLQERKGAKTGVKEAELGSIKVNQGEINKKDEEMPAELVGCRAAFCRGPSRTGRCSASKLAGSEPDWQEASAPSGERVRTDVNLTKLKPIKVDQGDIFYPERERKRPGSWVQGANCLWGISPHRRCRCSSIPGREGVRGRRVRGAGTKCAILGYSPTLS
jgi:hypothetical protein